MRQLCLAYSTCLYPFNKAVHYAINIVLVILFPVLDKALYFRGEHKLIAMRSYWSLVLVIAVLAIGCDQQEKTVDIQAPTTNTPTQNEPLDNAHTGHDHDGHDHSDHDGHDHSSDVSGEPLDDVYELKPGPVDDYAKQIQTKLAGVQRIEVDVTDQALDAGGPGIWKRLDVYKIDDKIVQIEVVPIQGELTETFFYKDWLLVHAFIDMNGLNNSVLDESETALRYYFSQEESIMPSVGDMGIPTDEQIRQKGNTVLNVAVNSKK